MLPEENATLPQVPTLREVDTWMMGLRPQMKRVTLQA